VTDDEFKAEVLAEMKAQTFLLETIAGAFAVEEVEETAECQHPDDSRVSFATPQRPDHWICNVCRYEHHGVTRN
jgi:hypothetical protein